MSGTTAAAPAPGAASDEDEGLDALSDLATIESDQAYDETVAAQWRTKLTGRPLTNSGLSWLIGIAITILGGLLRFINLGNPHEVVFDETYYAKDAFGLLVWGYEHNTLDKANELLLKGVTQIWSPGASFVVHPPLGKWLIAVGEAYVGMTPTGWRTATALLGTLLILLVARIGRRLTRSTLVGSLAALFVAVDGLAITMSRTGLLDGILAFFIAAGFGSVLIDRDRARSRLAIRVARDPSSIEKFGPTLGFRRWRFLAGFFFGCALATKWSAIYYIAVFAVIVVVWDYLARRTVGSKHPMRNTLLRDFPPALVCFVIVPISVYVISWSGWFATSGGWDRHLYPSPGATGFASLAIVGAFQSLLSYHDQMWQFHIHLTTHHNYQANPWGWPLMWRPTVFSYHGDAKGCQVGVTDCRSEVTALGNPLIWWFGALALIHQAWRVVSARDWRSAVVVAGFLAGWVPWLFFPHRTTFTFYAIAWFAFTAIALAMSAAQLLGGPDASKRRRQVGSALVTVGVVLIVAVSAWYYPLWANLPLSVDQWNLRILFSNWI
jgi:dolichyl-phosphate-mannose-protein mannosyltransferase